MQKLLLLLSKQADGLLKYLIASIMIGVPLYPKFPFISIPLTQVSIRLEDLLIFVAVIIWGFTVLPSINGFLKDRINRSLILFWFSGFISILVAIFISRTVVPQISILHWARRVEYMICFFVAYSSIRTREDLQFYIKILMLIVIGAFVYGVGQKYFNWPVITTQNSEYAKGVALRYMEGGHLVSTFAGHYDMASYLILVSPLLYVVAFSKDKVLKGLNLFSSIVFSRIFVILVITSGYWLLVNAASRISMVSYVGSMSLALLLIKRYKIIPIFLILSLVFIGSSSNLIDRYIRIITVAVEKISIVEPSYVIAADTVEGLERREKEESSPTPTPIFEDRSTSIRLNVEWPRAIRAFSKNPILGSGYSSITLATDNDYLRMIGEIGILGTGAFIVIIYRIFFKLVSSVRSVKEDNLEKIFLISLISALPGIFLNMVFIDILEASKFAITFWLLFGLGVGVSIKKIWLKK